MDKPTCLCGEVMSFLMDNKKHVIWECPNCGRLLLRPNYADWQRWYIPEEGDDYEHKKEEALGKVTATLEECLAKFHGEEDDRIREAIANYTVGYLGVSYGLHVKR